jgi:hypothetical protein
MIDPTRVGIRARDAGRSSPRKIGLGPVRQLARSNIHASTTALRQKRSVVIIFQGAAEARRAAIPQAGVGGLGGRPVSTAAPAFGLDPEQPAARGDVAPPGRPA